MDPLVSFIIPFYNNGDTITETIASVLNQSYSNYDIWIVNDGSTESASTEALNHFNNNPKITIINQDNAGPAIARNNAIRQTAARIVVPLDADDTIEPTATAKAVQYLEANKGTGVVYGNLKLFGEKNEIKKQPDFELQKQFIYNQVAMCAFIKKEVFETAGYFDEYLSKPGLEDWEFWIRVGQAGWKFKNLDETLFNIRVNNNSRTFRVANKNIELIKDYVFKKHYKLMASEYYNLFYEKKMALETPDYRIGHIAMKPWRFLKSLLKK